MSKTRGGATVAVMKPTTAKPTSRERAIAVLAPVSVEVLSRLTLSDGFRTYFDGDRIRISRMLTEAASDPETGLALAVEPGAQIIGFLSACRPSYESPLYSVMAAVEITMLEVAHDRRGQGIFTKMFHSLFDRRLEESIIYLVADPELRDRHESVRAFRDRLEAVLGSTGLVPLPTDDVALHPHHDATFFVRVGRGVATSDVEDFYKRLRTSAYASVAISLKKPFIRNLLRDDLERNGFYVRSVSSGAATEPADIVITDAPAAPGRLLTVHLNGEVELHWRDETLWFPMAQLDRLAKVLCMEIENKRLRNA